MARNRESAQRRREDNVKLHAGMTDLAAGPDL